MTVASQSQSVTYAGFWRRLLAFILDSTLYSALLLPVLYLVYGPEYFVWLTTESSSFAVFGFVDFLLTYVLAVILIILFWTRQGATPGKLMLDCRVVDVNTLQTLSTKKAIIRCLAYVISALPFYLGFVWMAFDKRKQALHDKLAGTLVIYRPDDDASRSLDELMEALK